MFLCARLFFEHCNKYKRKVIITYHRVLRIQYALLSLELVLGKSSSSMPEGGVRAGLFSRKRPPRKSGDDDDDDDDDGAKKRRRVVEKASSSSVVSFAEFTAQFDVVERTETGVWCARRLDDTTNATTSSLERIDFSNAVATPSDLYGAYLGLMRSGLWLECRPRVELGVRGDAPLLCLRCEPNPKPEAKRNGTTRVARQKTKAYAFAVNRGLIDDEFLNVVANRDGLDRLADPSKAAAAASEGGGVEAKPRAPRPKSEKGNEQNEDKEEDKEEETYGSTIVVTIDSDGTTTAMRVSRGFVEPDELCRKDEDANDALGDREEETDIFFGDDEANKQGHGGGGGAKMPAGALDFSSSDDDIHDLDDDDEEVG